MSQHTDKKKITQSEYLQLLGLKVLADRRNKTLYELRDAIMEITGETSEDGYALDVVFDHDETVDVMLKRLEISVVK